MYSVSSYRVFVTACSAVVLLAGTVLPAEAGEHELRLNSPVELHGYLETRVGTRLQNDRYEKDSSILETRLQAEIAAQPGPLDLKYKGDVWADGITEAWEYDTREAWLFFRPTEQVDIKLGRQILTWGTGELVFLNDLFPKDWRSFFIGRDREYLKAPSDAAKLGLFSEIANLDLVYTPRFDPDRFVTGEYLSYWNASLNRLAGRDVILHADEPDRSFKDAETAVRLYRNVNNYELALYGYNGFWKRPAGQNAAGQAIFPKLNVYGASARGQAGPGIANIELAYYESTEDRHGTKPRIDNSEMRYLVGYSQELATDFTAGIQYYVEQMLAYNDYKANLGAGLRRDHYRHVITLQMNKFMLGQNLELSLAAYYSPSDADAYIMPKAHYKLSDHTEIEASANIFVGEEKSTFFGQFEKNSNINTAFRYSF